MPNFTKKHLPKQNIRQMLKKGTLGQRKTASFMAQEAQERKAPLLKGLGTKGYAFRNYYNPLFLLTRKARKRIKNLSGFIAFCFHQTVASYRAAPRYDFHSQVRKNHAEQPPQIAVKARLFITAITKASSAHMNVSASEPQHFVYSRSFHAEFR